METKTPQSVCFAYFGDGKFIGWYADTFGSISLNSPKVYSNFDSIRATITQSFRNKLAKVAEGKINTSNIPHTIGAAIVNAGLNKDAEILANFKTVELRAVACPFYDVPNPDFDREAYEDLIDERKIRMNEAGIFDIPAPSKQRTDAVDAFNRLNPRPKCDNWIYADYALVKEWAKTEPTQFLALITAK